MKHTITALVVLLVKLSFAQDYDVRKVVSDQNGNLIRVTEEVNFKLQYLREGSLKTFLNGELVEELKIVGRKKEREYISLIAVEEDLTDTHFIYRFYRKENKLIIYDTAQGIVSTITGDGLSYIIK